MGHNNYLIILILGFLVFKRINGIEKGAYKIKF